MKTYRQGDVLLVAVEANPLDPGATIGEDLIRLPREKGRVVLAHGEITGHHHAIADERAELLAPDGSEFVTVDEAAELYLLVHGTEPVALVHEEHATITVAPGAYKVVRQREYQPEQIRRVAD